MKNILLVCAAGMSTSLLVTKMKAAAKEKNVEVDISAIPIAELEKTLSSQNVDVVMLGPQVRYKDNEIKKNLTPKNIPSEYIDTKDYGLMNGAKVLERALELAK